MAFEHYIDNGGRQLRCGYTTGTCAALAARGAATLLLTGKAPESVSVLTPKGWTVEVVPEFCRKEEERHVCSCGIRKDAGDDPDITDGLLIVATVRKLPVPEDPAFAEAVRIDGGDGVGRVTKPGLDQPVGEAAINHVPRNMIRTAVMGVCEGLEYDPLTEGPLEVILSIPEGAEKAARTFNPKLGVEGGLSILGTSGVVEPMSEQAMRDTILLQLRQTYELKVGIDDEAPEVILTPGNYGMDYLHEQDLDTLGVPVVKISNYVGDALDAAVNCGFNEILLVGHIGKLVKVAGGIMNTHSSVADGRMELMAAHAAVCGVDRDTVREVMACTTTDAALACLKKAGLADETLLSLSLAVQNYLEERVSRAGGKSVTVGAVLFSDEYGTLMVTDTARSLVKKWRKEAGREA